MITLMETIELRLEQLQELIDDLDINDDDYIDAKTYYENDINCLNNTQLN